MKNAPATPALWPASSILVVALHGSQISKTPKKLMANAVKMTAMKAMKPALWNCMPQPADPPPALTAATTAAKIQKLHKMPAVVAPPKVRSRPRLSPACLIKLNNFSESTGSTHGIRFRIIPPRKAKSSSAMAPARFSAASEVRSSVAFTALFSAASGAFVSVLAATSVSASFFFALLVLAGAEFPLSEIVLLAGARQIELSQAW